MKGKTFQMKQQMVAKTLKNLIILDNLEALRSSGNVPLDKQQERQIYFVIRNYNNAHLPIRSAYA